MRLLHNLAEGRILIDKQGDATCSDLPEIHMNL